MKYPKVKFDVKRIVRLYKAGKNGPVEMKATNGRGAKAGQ